MSTDWVVTTAAERIALDPQKRGETTFTVTNPGRRADRAVFEVVPSDGADRSWFSVEEPQRLVRGNASVAYLMKVAVAANAPAGNYAVQGRVYSADSAPEENSVLSGRVMLEVEPAPAPEPKKKPWWLLVVAALVVIVLVVVGIVACSGDDPAASGPVSTVVPDVRGKTEAEATEALQAAGLRVGAVTHRHDGERKDEVLEQSQPAGQELDPNSTVDLQVAVTLTRPKTTAPRPGLVFASGSKYPPLAWTQEEKYIKRWQVIISQQVCTATGSGTSCRWATVDIQTTDEPKLAEPQLSFVYRFNNIVYSNFHSGWVQWAVAPFDEIGAVGPFSAPVTFQMWP